MIRCASFDIGKKNFSFYIEEFDKNSLPSSLEMRYNLDGSIDSELKTQLNKIYNNGKTILHKNYNLETCLSNDIKKKRKKRRKKGDILISTNKEKKDTKCIENSVFFNMIDVLNKYIEEWKQCEYFIIEKQMCFKQIRNVMAVKLGQHCFSYFCLLLGRSYEDKIIEFPAHHKTKILGAPKIDTGQVFKNGNIKYKAMDKPQRKKWAIQEATRILQLRKAEDLMIKHKKKDDLADTLLQTQAFKILKFCG